MLLHRSRLHRRMLTWLWQPAAGWLVLAMLYLVVAVVLTMFLAIASSAWWPWLLVSAMAAAAGQCVVAGLHRRG